MLYKDYENIIKNRMGEKRFNHSVNVAKEAVRLAKKYGADPDKALIAGILHDITKETPYEEQLQIINKGGIILDKVEKIAPKLYHSISGSVYIRDFLDITDKDIINAVRYHTTGRANMSVLEKVVFLADFTSSERDYEDVDIMRKKTNMSLDDGMLYGLSFTIKNLIDKGAAVHQNAINAYNEIIVKREVQK